MEGSSSKCDQFAAFCWQDVHRDHHRRSLLCRLGLHQENESVAFWVFLYRPVLILPISLPNRVACLRLDQRHPSEVQSFLSEVVREFPTVQGFLTVGLRLCRPLFLNLCDGRHVHEPRRGLRCLLSDHRDRLLVVSRHLEVSSWAQKMGLTRPEEATIRTKKIL